MKSMQFDTSTLEDVDLDGWSDETQDGVFAEQATDEDTDDKAEDKSQDDDTKDDEKFANGSDDDTKSDDTDTSKDDDSKDDDSKDDADTKDDADDKSDDTKDEKAEKEEDDDLLLDIIENGSDALSKAVDKELAKRDAAAQAEADEKQVHEDGVKEAQERFTSNADDLMEQVGDYADIVNDKLFEKIMKNADVAMNIFDAEENAKAAYVYGKTGIVFSDADALNSQFDALAELNPYTGETKERKDKGVPQSTTGGGSGSSAAGSYTSLDEVGWDD